MPRCSGATSLIRKKYFLPMATTAVMVVLSLLALLVGVGGFWVIPPEGFGSPSLDVWFWPFLYPLMPALKGQYISAVYKAYPLSSYNVVVSAVSWPFPAIGVYAVYGYKVMFLWGFQIPAVGLPFLVHIPYWLALSHGLTYGLTYGLSALIHRYR